MATTKEEKFIWKRWVCPLGRNANEFSEFADEDEELSEYEKMEEDKYKGQRIVPNMVMTSFGLVPIFPFNNPAKAFKWWVLHTPFKLTNTMLGKVDEVLGVEIMEPFSPYQLRISVGQCFIDKEVKTRVEKSLLGVLSFGTEPPANQKDKGNEVVAETI